MIFNPADYNIPPHFKHWGGDPAEDHIGPFFSRFANDKAECAMRVLPHHCNTYGIVHGGVLMAFADYVLGVAAIGQDSEMSVTVSCNQEFVSPAYTNELIIGRSERVRKTSTLVFTRGTLLVKERVIMTMSGIFKRIRPKI